MGQDEKAREKFEKGLDLDYRYKYQDWVKEQRNYPSDIYEIYEKSGFGRPGNLKENVKNKFYKRFPPQF